MKKRWHAIYIKKEEVEKNREKDDVLYICVCENLTMQISSLILIDVYASGYPIINFCMSFINTINGLDLH